MNGNATTTHAFSSGESATLAPASSGQADAAAKEAAPPEHPAFETITILAVPRPTADAQQPTQAAFEAILCLHHAEPPTLCPTTQVLCVAGHEPERPSEEDRLAAERPPEIPKPIGLAAARHRAADRQYAERYRLDLGTLTDDERRVLEAVCDGQLNKQIAREMGVSIRTIEQRRRRVFTKMKVESVAPLAARRATALTIERLNRRRDSDANPR